MPITSIPATAEGMPKFDRAAIMRDAWSRWRWFRQTYAPWQISRGIIRETDFASCLRRAWAAAKKAQAAKVEEIRIAAIMDTPAGERIRALRDAIDRADYASFRYSSSQIKADLSRELQTVIAAATQGAGHNAALSA